MFFIVTLTLFECELKTDIYLCFAFNPQFYKRFCLYHLRFFLLQKLHSKHLIFVQCFNNVRVIIIAVYLFFIPAFICYLHFWFSESSWFLPPSCGSTLVHQGETNKTIACFFSAWPQRKWNIKAPAAILRLSLGVWAEYFSNNVSVLSSERVYQRATNCCCRRNLHRGGENHRPLRGRARCSAQNDADQLETGDKTQQNRSGAAGEKFR